MIKTKDGRYKTEKEAVRLVFDGMLYHVRVISHSSVFTLFFQQFKQDGQIDDVLLIQTKFFLQHISVPVDTVLSEREKTGLNICVRVIYRPMFIVDLTNLHIDVFRL